VLVGVMAAVVGVLLAVLLVTRGGDEPDPAELLAGVPDAVADAGTARLAMAVAVNGGSLDVSVDGTGQVDFDTAAGTFDVSILGTKLEMRTDGSTLYVRPDGDQTWLAAKADEADPLNGSFGTGPSEAVAFVDLLRGKPGKIEEREGDEIGGVDTRHLRTTIDVADAAEQAGDVSRAALEQLATLAPSGGRIPVDVWIDGEGRLVRERLRGTLQGVDLTVTVDLSDWGDPIEAEIPPEGEIRPVEPQELVQLFTRPVG
jgi:hypothetical protein